MPIKHPKVDCIGNLFLSTGCPSDVALFHGQLFNDKERLILRTHLQAEELTFAQDEVYRFVAKCLWQPSARHTATKYAPRVGQFVTMLHPVGTEPGLPLANGFAWIKLAVSLWKAGLSVVMVEWPGFGTCQSQIAGSIRAETLASYWRLDWDLLTQILRELNIQRTHVVAAGRSCGTLLKGMASTSSGKAEGSMLEKEHFFYEPILELEEIFKRMVSLPDTSEEHLQEVMQMKYESALATTLVSNQARIWSLENTSCPFKVEESNRLLQALGDGSKGSRLVGRLQMTKITKADLTVAQMAHDLEYTIAILSKDLSGAIAKFFLDREPGGERWHTISDFVNHSQKGFLEIAMRGRIRHEWQDPANFGKGGGGELASSGAWAGKRPSVAEDDNISAPSCGESSSASLAGDREGPAEKEDNESKQFPQRHFVPAFLRKIGQAKPWNQLMKRPASAPQLRQVGEVPKMIKQGLGPFPGTPVGKASRGKSAQKRLDTSASANRGPHNRAPAYEEWKREGEIAFESLASEAMGRKSCTMMGCAEAAKKFGYEHPDEHKKKESKHRMSLKPEMEDVAWAGQTESSEAPEVLYGLQFEQKDVTAKDLSLESFFAERSPVMDMTYEQGHSHIKKAREWKDKEDNLRIIKVRPKSAAIRGCRQKSSKVPSLMDQIAQSQASMQVQVRELAIMRDLRRGTGSPPESEGGNDAAALQDLAIFSTASPGSGSGPNSRRSSRRSVSVTDSRRSVSITESRIADLESRASPASPSTPLSPKGRLKSAIKQRPSAALTSQNLQTLAIALPPEATKQRPTTATTDTRVPSATALTPTTAAVTPTGAAAVTPAGAAAAPVPAGFGSLPAD
eukprot:TRINITY_DN11466_c2_g5_i1.p1 TRINITY_DN11466_c2_g5~~TRINITY_DN11466_c2_g5_i1.p1  ORF type:complete len:852 (-),score=128.88 TRINITY_DN11466_c2_g5_i1:193-2748(-)